jgi:outer membrane protein TolC
MAKKIFALGVLILLAGVARAQGPASIPQTTPTANYLGPAVVPLSPVVPQNPYAGSVSGGPVPGVLELTLDDAINRALKQNLGALLTSDATGGARSDRLRQLANLLPNVTTLTSANMRQLDLTTFGFKFNFPGINIPSIVGPFGYFDTRAYFSQSLFNWEQISRVRSTNANLQSAQYSYKDARDLVVQAAGTNYFATIAAAARVDTAQAQVNTAQALYNQASDQLKAGVTASIDALRAQVELQTRQQQLIAARNNLDKQKLILARVIGLPPGQQFEITAKARFDALSGPTLEEALQRAYTTRADFKAAEAQVRAAELARKAAQAERYPTVDFDADYGDIGITPGHSHGTFDLAGVLRVPVFQGGHVRADIIQADASVAQSRTELENLRGQIDQDVRDAFLDLQSSSDQVKVEQSTVELANQTLQQAQDRFKAGVTDNIEVVQAQESVASANESYIESLYNFNVAKISLARAVGLAEDNVKQFFKGY